MPNGHLVHSPPKKFGAITNGHHIKMADNPTPWDQSFERTFQEIDSAFPGVIRWLQSLDRNEIVDARTMHERIQFQEYSDQKVDLLLECLISLAVRAPKFRNAVVDFVKQHRNHISKAETERLIGLNIRDSQKSIYESLASTGTFLILYTTKQEFIYGDGFFHNLSYIQKSPFDATILAPITPHISALFSSSYGQLAGPRLSTIVLSNDEAKFLNDTVQVYSKDFIFYRSQMPDVTDSFRNGEHLIYSSPSNPISNLASQLSQSTAKYY